MKETGMRIRIEPELRDQIMVACRSQDLPAAHLFRTSIKGFVQPSQSLASAAVMFRKKSAMTDVEI